MNSRQRSSLLACHAVRIASAISPFKIAAKYAELVRAGSSAPVEETTRELFGDIRLHRDLVRDALNRARELELLTRPPVPRRPGGELTQLGRDALEQGRA